MCVCVCVCDRWTRCQGAAENVVTTKSDLQYLSALGARYRPECYEKSALKAALQQPWHCSRITAKVIQKCVHRTALKTALKLLWNDSHRHRKTRTQRLGFAFQPVPNWAAPSRPKQHLPWICSESMQIATPYNNINNNINNNNENRPIIRKSKQPRNVN